MRVLRWKAPMNEPNMLQQSLMMTGATAFVAISVKTGNELSHLWMIKFLAAQVIPLIRTG